MNTCPYEKGCKEYESNSSSERMNNLKSSE